jgi:acyl-CoA dehydrogenase
VKRSEDEPAQATAQRRIKNGANLASVLSIAEMCWGDTALLLALPRQGLGNSAIASVADDAQQAKFAGTWAAMAITEPGMGSDSAALTTTATKDGDEYVLNGEKIFVTSGDRADSVVVWATLDKSLGRAAIKSFVVRKRTPGMTVESAGAQARHPCLRHRGHHVRPTAGCPRRTSWVRPEIDTSKGFAGAMATFDNTRPLVAAMAVGCARASLDLTPRPARAAGWRSTTTDRRTCSRRRSEVPPDGGRLGGRKVADDAGCLEGRQPTTQLAGGLDGQGQGGTSRE